MFLNFKFKLYGNADNFYIDLIFDTHFSTYVDYILFSI